MLVPSAESCAAIPITFLLSFASKGRGLRAYKHKDLCFEHHPACSLPWQCLPWRRMGYQVHVLLLGLIKLPQVPLGNRIPQVYLAGVFFSFLFIFFFSVIPRTNKMSFSAYLHTDTEQGLIMFPYHCPSLISCV